MCMSGVCVFSSSNQMSYGLFILAIIIHLFIFFYHSKGFIKASNQ